MGPHFFKCGKRTPPSCMRRIVSCFNGAALFQVRKVRIGRKRLTRYLGFNGAALFQVRKAGERGRKPADKQKLQWGRTFSSAESDKRPRRHLWRNQASMGPHFFKCGKCWTDFYVEMRRLSASMGPHFFKCGKKLRRIASESNQVLLQWGRTFSSAERLFG